MSLILSDFEEEDVSFKNNEQKLKVCAAECLLKFTIETLRNSDPLWGPGICT